MIKSKIDLEEGTFNFSTRWQFAIIWLTLSFIVSVFLYQSNQIKSETKLREIEREQTQTTTQLFRTLKDSFSQPISDIDFIERQLKRSTLSKHQIEQLFIDLITSRQLSYIQMRLIDIKGYEQVRVDTSENDITVVNEADYQNKANRYYIKEALSLAPGQTFISPMDLNVENGKIEQPFKPTVRFARLLTSKSGKQYIIVINFDASKILAEFDQAESDHTNHQFWLINEQGYWYKASEAETEWGHILNERKEINLAAQYPHIWNAIQQNHLQHFQAIVKDSLVTTERLSAKSTFANIHNLKINEQDDLIVIGFIKETQLNQMIAPHFLDKVMELAVVLLVSALAAILIVRTNIHRTEIRVRQKRQQKQIEAILENSPDAIFVLDSNYKIVSSNHQATLLFGYDKTAITHLNIDKIFDDYRNPLSTKLLSQIPDNQTFLATKQDKTHITIAVNSNRIVIDEDELTLLSMRDVTFQLELEKKLKKSLLEAELANEAKSEFLANMSHEIRSPLNGVIGMLSILNDESTIKPKQKVLVNQASASAKLLLRVINDILDISKINTSVLTLETHPFDLEILLKDIGHTMSPISEAKKIELLCPANISDNFELVGDEGRIKQILLNLISNAIKFTDKGHIRVKVATQREQNTCHLNFTVIDTGIGIPQAQVAHVFERFTQIDGSITRKVGGTGLGLAICSELVALMNGTISVKSTLGQGSSFDVNLRLPIVTALTLHKYDIDSSIKVICMLHNDALAETIISFTESWGLNTHRIHDFRQLSEHLNKTPRTDKLILISEHHYLSKLSDEINNEQLNKLNGIIFISSLIDSMSEIDLMINSNTMVKPIIPSELFNNIIALARNEDAEQQTLLTTQNEQPILNIKLLLVEDDIINLKVAENILEKNGCTIKTVMNGQEALDALQSEHFDLVLMDCHMPIMDGYTATKLIRNGKAGEKNVTIPIIALTANALAGEDKRCIDAGMSDYISKPFETEELIKRILKWSSKTT